MLFDTFARVGVWVLFALCALVWFAPSGRIEVLAVATWLVAANIMTVVLLVQYLRNRRLRSSNERTNKR